MRGFLFCAAAALVLCASGCVRLEAETSLDRNGGGVYRLSFAMSEQTRRDLAAMARFGAESGIPPLGLPDPAALDEARLRRSCADNGVEIKRLEIPAAGDPGVEMVLAFPDLESLAAAMTAALGSDRLCPFLAAAGGGDYVLAARPGPPHADPRAPAPAAVDLGGMSADSLSRLEEISARLVRAADDLRFRFVVRVPGRVLEHNSHRIENGACVWELGAENLLQAPELAPRLVFSGGGLDLPVRPPE